ncbi:MULTISPECIES: hypothetical protein [Bacillus subtilis group]|uniref:hypothetical protein n=1 Tax=Bacillus subtilis group TaxID=653685 RepID=UPI001B164289|nr:MULTISPECIES: hypothetical protein [Bacillus subtilis group]MED4337896.1 hypothetical protein [Bacillus licheniformis]MED4371100.1 hypothetical protein [Bacillus licheniformis]GIN55013.1 hypothetical protein J36TS2_39070 [Bacillus paralicheniformis]
MLKKDDHVVMHTCYEASKHDGKIWRCTSDEFTSNSGARVVYLKGFSGFFAVEFLQKVNAEGMLGFAMRRAFKLQERIDRYQKALEFYADKSKYYPEFKDEKFSPIEFDEGQTARKVLKEE